MSAYVVGSLYAPDPVYYRIATYLLYQFFISIVIIALGILVFRQRVIAAIGLSVFIVATDVLDYLVPAFHDDGVAGISAEGIAGGAISLILTAIVVIADCVARSNRTAPGRIRTRARHGFSR
jgi:hypothetical protein